MNNDGGGDGGASVSPEDQAFIADFCAAVVPCCMANKVTVDNAVCKQSLAKLGMSGDAQLRSACLDQLRHLSTTAGCLPDIADLGGPCARVFYEPSGPRAPGETCKTAKECQGSPGTITQCFSTCITYALGAANDYPCLGNVYTTGVINDIPWKNGSNTPESHAFLCELRDGLFCDLSDNVCHPVLPAGGACTTALPGLCESGLCSDNGCLPLPAAGEPCTDQWYVAGAPSEPAEARDASARGHLVVPTSLTLRATITWPNEQDAVSCGGQSCPDPQIGRKEHQAHFPLDLEALTNLCSSSEILSGGRTKSIQPAASA